MTKEERAEKWFHNIPGAEGIAMETKMKICSVTAKLMALIFFAVFIAEMVLLFIISDGEIFNLAADFLNGMLEGSHRYTGVAVIGVLMCLPVFVLPIIAMIIFRNIRIKSKAAAAMNNYGTYL